MNVTEKLSKRAERAASKRGVRRSGLSGRSRRRAEVTGPASKKQARPCSPKRPQARQATKRPPERPEVELVFCDDRHLPGLLEFRLPEEQLEFTALPADSLAAAAEDPERHPVVVTAGDEAVGFFVLQDGAGAAEFYGGDRALLMRGFLVNRERQGQGYALAALELLPAFAARHFRRARKLVLAVNESNLAALRLYKRAGFADTGRRREGPKGRQLILRVRLARRGPKSGPRRLSQRTRRQRRKGRL